jgi:predicted metal-binding membrane protein
VIAAGRAPLEARPGRSARVPAVVLAAIAGAWVLTVLAQATRKAAFLNHGALIEGSGPFHLHPPLWVALPLFLLAWQVMVVAMMLPSSLPMVRLFRVTIANVPQRARTMSTFLSGYLLVWGAFGAVAFVQDIAVHRTVDAHPWLQAHTYVIAGTALLLAGAFQFSSLKDKCLRECRAPGAFLLKHYDRGAGAAFRLGRKHGLFCLGCCWALMLVMFGAGVANLWWMPALAVLMFYEKAGRYGDRIVPFVGAAFLILSGLVFLHPAWLPPIFGTSA